MTRREAVAVGLGMGAAVAQERGGGGRRITVGDALERIRKGVGVAWRDKTVDKLLVGDEGMEVTGIATTMMATMDVLRRAAGAGANLVITHETPFYMHQDETGDLAGDGTLEYKRRFLAEHGMAVFHFHDHWHARAPDGIAEGMARELGWTKNAEGGRPPKFRFDGARLADLVEDMARRLGARTMRVVGDRDLRVRRAVASWGYVGRMPGIAMLREEGIEMMVCGETREWELVEYAQDTVERGERKALVVIGHVASEQAGMMYCAEWLRRMVSEAPVVFVPAREPFWTPEMG